MPGPDRKVRVLHLRSTNFYGGPERQLHRHALAMKDSPFEIVLASFAEQGQPPALLQIAAADNLRTHLFTVENAYDRRSIGLIRQFLKDENIAVFCTHDYRASILGCFAARGADTRWITFSRGRTSETLAIRLYFRLERLLFRFADRIVAVSDGEKQSLMRQFVPERRISVVHNAIDIAPFAAVTPVDLHARFGFPPDSIVALAGGRFSPEKGQSYLVEAAAALLRRNDRLRFVLFGDGPLWDSIRGQIEERCLTDRILCPGFEKNMPGCIKGSDMVVNPSLSEGLPNIVLEAMALRIPVVATAVGGVPEVVHDDDTGLLLPAADCAALADAIERLAGDPTLRNRLAEKAFGLIRTSFSFEKQARELTTVYQSVLNRSGRNV